MDELTLQEDVYSTGETSVSTGWEVVTPLAAPALAAKMLEKPHLLRMHVICNGVHPAALPVLLDAVARMPPLFALHLRPLLPDYDEGALALMAALVRRHAATLRRIIVSFGCVTDDDRESVIGALRIESLAAAVAACSMHEFYFGCHFSSPALLVAALRAPDIRTVNVGTWEMTAECAAAAAGAAPHSTLRHLKTEYVLGDDADAFRFMIIIAFARAPRFESLVVSGMRTARGRTEFEGIVAAAPALHTVTIKYALAVDGQRNLIAAMQALAAAPAMRKVVFDFFIVNSSLMLLVDIILAEHEPPIELCCRGPTQYDGFL